MTFLCVEVAVRLFTAFRSAVLPTVTRICYVTVGFSVKSSFFRGLDLGRRLLTEKQNSISIICQVAIFSRVVGAWQLLVGLARVEDNP